MSSSIRVAAGVVIAVAFLWLAFGRVDWTTVTTVLTNARLTPLAIGLVALAAGFFVRIVRWWAMLRALEPTVRLRSCVRPFLVSLAINNTLPLRAGDIARALAFRDALRSPASRIVGTLLIERVLDLFVLLVMFAIGLSALSGTALPRAFVVAAAALAVGTFAGLLILVLAPARLRAFADWLLARPAVASRSWIPRARDASHQLLSTFSLVQSPTRAAQLLALSVLAWVLEGAMYACVAWSLHVNATWLAPWFAAATGTLATLIPSSPGYAGTFDYFAMLGMTAFGASRAAATAFALVVHLVLWLPVTLTGAAFLATPGATAALSRASRQRSPA